MLVAWRIVSLGVVVCILLFAGKCNGYDCVFGFSTGHVGTGTISTKSSYKGVNHVEFFFEGVNKRTSKQARISFDRYHSRGGMTVRDEVTFVRDHLSPLFSKVATEFNTSLMFDIGHANLFYYRGIAHYFSDKMRTIPFCDNLRFVRVRRERYETAQSLLYGMGGKLKPNLCDSVSYGYCPFKNSRAVVLHPPGESAWKNFSVFQQMLWFTDETEARWQILKKQYNSSSIQFSEVYWSTADNSLERCVDIIGDFIGASRRSPNPLAITHVHSKQFAQDKHKIRDPDEDVARRTHMEVDSVYKAVMCDVKSTCRVMHELSV